MTGEIYCAICLNLGPGEGGIFPTCSGRLLMGVSPKTLATVLLVQADGHDAIRVFDEPREGAACKGEVPSGEKASCSDRRTNFFRVHWQGLEGWIGIKNVYSPCNEDHRKSNTIAEWTDRTPRTASAGHDFGLVADNAAKKRWANIAQHNPQDRLQKATQSAAILLNFLALTVQSREEIEIQQLSRCKANCLELYSLSAGIPAVLKDELVKAACEDSQGSRSVGAIVGMAVGDALGAPFEFLDAVDTPGEQGAICEPLSVATKGAPNKFRVKPGQWTDDSSMGLCLLDSLLACGCYDGSDARVRFHNWWFRGYNNAFGNDSRIGSIGLGGNVSKSLRDMRPGETPTGNYESKGEDAGNGSIMRLAPVAVFFSSDSARAARASAASSFSTHPGQIAAAACAFLGFAISKAILRVELEQSAAAFLDQVVADFVRSEFPGTNDCPEIKRLLRSAEPPGKYESWNWRASQLQIKATLRARGRLFNGYPCTASYFGSYCIDGLAIALWSFYHTTSFSEAITRCVNFLGDADTTAAVCGQLAGAFYGFSAIDGHFVTKLQKWDDMDIACRAALLFATRHGSVFAESNL